MMKPSIVLLSLAAALAIGACNQSAPAPSLAQEASPTPLPTATATPTPVPTATPTPEPTPTPLPTSTLPPAAGLPTGDSPAEVLDASAAAMRDVQSFHFELDARVTTESSQGTSAIIPIRLTGDYQSPDRLRGRMAVSLGFIALEMETITIGSTTYVTNPQTGQWEVREGAMSLLPNPAELGSMQSQALDNLEMVGQETLNGEPVYHLRGTPPRDTFGSPEGEPAQADFWIGVNDLLIRQIKVTGATSLEAAGSILGGATGGTMSGSARLEATITFSRYGEPVTIEPPIT